MPETRSLHRKLAQVMYEAESIPKNGTAPASMGSFKFVQVGDAAKVIRKALAEKNVSMIPSAIEVISEAEHSTSSGKTMTTLTVRTTWTLTDGETGETAVIQSMGSGADTGDKATPKAQSNAMKYALLMGFLLSTGDDPEQVDTSDRRQRPVGNYDAPPARPELVREVHDPGGMVGTVEESKDSPDFTPRVTPDGIVVTFKLRGDGRGGGIKVIATSPIAEALTDEVGAEKFIGSRVSCWGRVKDESFTNKAGRTITYQILELERITGAFGEFTMDRQPPPIAEGQEALFSEAEEAAIDAALP